MGRWVGRHLPSVLSSSAAGGDVRVDPEVMGGRRPHADVRGG